jgi:hypothetical protein
MSRSTTKNKGTSSTGPTWKTYVGYFLFFFIILGIVMAAFTLGRLDMSLTDLGPIQTRIGETHPVTMGFIADEDAWIKNYDIVAVTLPNDRGNRQLVSIIFNRKYTAPAILPTVSPAPNVVAVAVKKKGKIAATPTPTPLPTPIPVPSTAFPGAPYRPNSRFVLKGIYYNKSEINKILQVVLPDPGKPPSVLVQFIDLGQKQPEGNNINLQRVIFESIK